MKDLRRQTVKRLVIFLSLAAILLLDSARVSANVTVSSFKAQLQGTAVQLTWTTATEVNNVGFHVLRSNSASGTFTQINASIISSKCLGCVVGTNYSYTDSTAVAGQTYYYKLQSVDSRGTKQQYGPVSVGSTSPTATAVRSATPVRTSVSAASATPIQTSVATATATPARTNTPVPAGSTVSAAAAVTSVSPSGATQPTPVTKVAIAVTGNQPTPVQPSSGTPVALNVRPSPPATVGRAPAMVVDESSEDEVSPATKYSLRSSN